MKITSGMWLARYWIAASALSALSTPISYFSRMRARNRRADLESSTINARLAAMPPPDGRLLEVYRRTVGGQSLSRAGDAPGPRKSSVLVMGGYSHRACARFRGWSTPQAIARAARGETRT